MYSDLEDNVRIILEIISEYYLIFFRNILVSVKKFYIKYYNFKVKLYNPSTGFC